MYMHMYLTHLGLTLQVGLAKEQNSVRYHPTAAPALVTVTDAPEIAPEVAAPARAPHGRPTVTPLVLPAGAARPGPALAAVQQANVQATAAANVASPPPTGRFREGSGHRRRECREPAADAAASRR